MIVPQFWAEARRHRPRGPGRGQITLRRFGWSDTSQEDAQHHAEQRAQAAFDQIVSGEKIPRNEPKIAYNGAEGVPIREEIVDRDRDTVITRNAYGAQCLNTPDVAFADIDFEHVPGIKTLLVTGAVLVLAALMTALWLRSPAIAIIGTLLAIAMTGPLTDSVSRRIVALRGGPERLAHERIRRFAALHPDWHLRVYRTPGGFRVLVMHDTYDPMDSRIGDFFKALRVDPVYAAMCRNQRCFRARVTPKPWRIGIGDHLRPRPGVWPVKPEHLPLRSTWIRAYEARAAQYGSCRFVEALGKTGSVHAKAESVRARHDRLSQALSGREIA